MATLASIKQTTAQNSVDQDEWETSGGKLQPKTGFAPNGISINTAATEYNKTFADYTSVGANLQVNSGTYENKVITGSAPFNDGNYQTDGSTPYTITPAAAYTAYNGSTVGQYYSTTSYIDIDLGASEDDKKTFVEYRLRKGGAGYVMEDWEIYGDNGGGWELLHTVTNDPATDGTWTQLYTITTTGAYRHYRVLCTGNSQGNDDIKITEIDFRESSFALIDNTADVNLHTGGSESFAPASFNVTDQNDANIAGSGKVNIDYKLNNTTFQGSLIDLETFKALDASIFANLTQLDIQVQPVGAQRIKDPSIDSTSGESLLLASGSLQAVINSLVVGAMGSNGYTFPDSTVQATAVNKVDAPSSASDTGTAGQIAWDADYIYICTATDTWERVAVATW